MKRTRRRFLGCLAGLGIAAPLPGAALGSAARDLWLSGRTDGGEHHATAFDANGHVAFDIALSSRAHGAAYSAANKTLAIVSRRPGDYVLLVDALTGRVRQRLGAAPGRFFNGHAIFAGRYLFTTETAGDGDEAHANGVIGVHDAARDYARVGEYRSHGHDPHELLAVDEHVLVVANGGLLTHPDAPGVKLNLATMDSSLVYLDRRDGRLLAQYRLPDALRQLSIRHLARAHDGTLALAMQHQGPAGERVPLVALHRPGARALEVLETPDPVLARMRNYCGSAAFDASGRVLGVSSPRGGVAVFWRVDAAAVLGYATIDDGCGLAAAGATADFIVSSGLGGVFQSDARATRRVDGDALLARSHWDNHLTLLQGSG